MSKKAAAAATAAPGAPAVDPNTVPTAVWGVSYEKAAARSDPRGIIPAPIQDAVDFINASGLDSEGLYRIPGSAVTVNAIKAIYDKGERYTYKPYEFDEAASVVINWMRHTEDGMFADKYDQLSKALDSDDPKQIEAAMRQMPLANRETCRLLVDHLVKIAAHSEKNKMSLYNLAICFGGKFSKIIPALAKHAATCFPDTIVFGVPLATAVQRSGPKATIPLPIRVAVEFLEATALNDSLLYQESGLFSKIKEYRYQFNSGVEVQFNKHESAEAAGIINAFFRDMQDYLFVREKKQEWLDAADLTDQKKRVEKFKALLESIPKQNHDLIKYLARHLARVAAASKRRALTVAEPLGRTYGKILAALMQDLVDIFGKTE